MTEKFGSGRFCSEYCSHVRTLLKATKEKIRISSKKSHPRLKIKYCKSCGKEINHSNKSGYCKNCLISVPELKSILIDAGKKGYQTSLKNGTHVGWQSRSIQSYPEQFWQKVLINNNISFEGPNKPVRKSDGINNYFLDFYIEVNDKKLDLEIDGKQHKYEDRHESDIKRDKYLLSLGYIIYRIDWNEINTPEGQLQMKEKIDKFVVFYNSL